MRLIKGGDYRVAISVTDRGDPLDVHRADGLQQNKKAS
jgi:hypothetical protein